MSHRSRRKEIVRRASVTGALLVLLTAGCARKQQPAGPENIAILPFENLSGDASLDQQAAAIPTLLVTSLAGIPNVHAFASRSLSDPQTARATRLVHGYLERRSGAARVRAVIENTPSLKMASSTAANGSSALTLADAIARSIDSRATGSGTSNESAAQKYAAALREGNAALAREAVAADPRFGAAHVALAQILLARGDREGARAALAEASRVKAEFRPIDRTRIESLQAAFESPERQLEAAERLARATPADASAVRSAAAAALRLGQNAKAAEWLARAVELDPERPELRNQLGYAHAWAGNLEAASRALEEYGKLPGHELNSYDSLGDVHFQSGDFAAAERHFLRAAEKDPAFLGGYTLLKAAHSRLMTGDVTGADGLANRYFDTVAKRSDPFVEQRRAQWQAISGRRDQALAYAGPAQRAVWSAEAGNYPGALVHARQAALAARTPEEKVTALTVALATAPAAAPEELARRVDAVPAPILFRRAALAYGLLLHGYFKNAEPLLRELIEASPRDRAGYLPTLLAWSLVEQGRNADAWQYLQRFPIPTSGLDPFMTLSIPRVLELRARAFDAQGKAGEAAKSREVFGKLSGKRL